MGSAVGIQSIVSAKQSFFSTKMRFTEFVKKRFFWRTKVFTPFVASAHQFTVVETHKNSFFTNLFCWPKSIENANVLFLHTIQ